jgi:RNA recognition motif-containing protein
MRQHPVHTSNNWREKPKESTAVAESENAPNTSWRKANSFDKSEPRTTEVNHPTPSNPEEDTAKAIAEGRRIYVGNLVYHATPDDVKSHIIEAGYTIERIDMSMDPFTGRNPSYCFVEFGSKEEADSAIETLTGTNLLGRVVKANSCVPRSRKRPKAMPLLDRWNRSDAEEHWRGIGQEKRRLFVGGLPKPETQLQAEKLIQGLFSGFET